MDATQIDKWLESRFAEAVDEKYREFNVRVVATVDPARVLGVRTPDLRRIAREAAQRPGIDAWLDELPHKFFESMQVHAFAISAMKDYDECVRRIDLFLPHVDNWATCDQMSPKVLAKRPDQTTAHALRWMESPHTYTCRFGIGTLMRHNLREHFDPVLLAAVAAVDRGDDYYVNMMRAWFVAEALVWRPTEALELLQNHGLDCWTHNKAIQKAIESRRVDDGLKDHLRTLRRPLTHHIVHTKGGHVGNIIAVDQQNPQLDIVSEAARVLQIGGVLVMPTDSVYGIGCAAVAGNPAHERIFAIKHRDRAQTLPWLIADSQELQTFGTGVPSWMQRLADQLWPGALTLVAQANDAVPPEYRAANGTIALRVPDSNLVRALARDVGPLATTSANTHGEAAATSGANVEKNIVAQADLTLDSGPAPLAIASTIVGVGENGEPCIFREGAIPASEIYRIAMD